MKKRREALESTGTPVKLQFRYPEILIINPKFRSGVIKLRAGWGIPDRGFKDTTAYNDWYEQLIQDEGVSSRYSELMTEINSLRLSLRKYPKHWNWFIYTYVTREEILEEYRLRSCNYPYKPSFTQEGDLITLRMYTNTTRKDLAPILSQVYKAQKSSDDYDNSRERKKLPRDIKILRKYLETHSIESIFDNSSFSTEERSSIDSDAERVRQAIKRLLKRIFPD